MQDFIASQVITAYRPDHDPKLDAFSMDVSAGNSGKATSTAKTAETVKWL
ncbi:TTL4 [Symbiodinium natans]|uniref:TTL4 protein n=1 Tax=Symbiodinium natans TaxID=878477 RepID=A0A812R6V3_9DINO|nr:TTL4 [Symbiodinium natans]